jgi:hypothetical protein
MHGIKIENIYFFYFTAVSYKYMLWNFTSSYLEILIHNSRSLICHFSYKIYCRNIELRSHIRGEFSHVIHLTNILIIKILLVNTHII